MVLCELALLEVAGNKFLIEALKMMKKEFCGLCFVEYIRYKKFEM